MTNPKHTDTSRSGDLVERLEEWALTLLAACEGGDLGTDEPAALMYQAADHIEALEAEVEQLRDALRDLLEDTQHSEHDCIDHDCPVKIARAALGEKQ